jgi:hypothetical protein
VSSLLQSGEPGTHQGAFQPYITGVFFALHGLHEKKSAVAQVRIKAGADVCDRREEVSDPVQEPSGQTETTPSQTAPGDTMAVGQNVETDGKARNGQETTHGYAGIDWKSGEKTHPRRSQEENFVEKHQGKSPNEDPGYERW